MKEVYIDLPATTVYIPALNAKEKHLFHIPRSRKGVVVGISGNKTVKVKYKWCKKHPKYGKFMNRQATLLAHDHENCCQIGDYVEFIGCRPISKSKKHRIVRIIPRMEKVIKTDQDIWRAFYEDQTDDVWDLKESHFRYSNLEKALSSKMAKKYDGIHDMRFAFHYNESFDEATIFLDTYRYPDSGNREFAIIWAIEKLELTNFLRAGQTLIKTITENRTVGEDIEEYDYLIRHKGSLDESFGRCSFSCSASDLVKKMEYDSKSICFAQLFNPYSTFMADLLTSESEEKHLHLTWYPTESYDWIEVLFDYLSKTCKHNCFIPQEAFYNLGNKVQEIVKKIT